MTLALICVLIAGLMPWFTVALAAPRLDQRLPRASALKLEGLPARAYAAHLNQFEAFPLFAAAVIVAHMLAGANRTVDMLAVGFIVLRLAHLGAYLGNVRMLRSLFFGLAVLVDIAIFLAPTYL